MKITIWDIFKYLNKWKIVIVIMVALSISAVAFYIDRNQSYSAEIIIRYTDQSAKSGFTPTGTKLDVYEIISPNIISGALADLNVKSSVESIRSMVAISPIIPDEIREIKKSKTKSGEDYDYFATDYSIKYTVGANKNGGYARDMLDAIIKNYSIYYSEHYLNNSIIPEIDFDINTEMHDYLEVAEIMDTTTKNIISYLEDYKSSSEYFRSSLTGMSFEDLVTEYNIIKNFDLTELFSNIVNAQITQNKELLIKKYLYRKEQYILNTRNKTEESNVALSLMEDFVNSNKSVPNSYNQNKNSDFNTNDVFVHDKLNRVKTTYDKLVDNYVIDGVSAGNSIADTMYCENMINAFTKPIDESIDYNIAIQNADNSILYIKDKMASLYKVTYSTIRDYNDLSSSNHIVSLSGITIRNGIMPKLYFLLAIVIGVLLGIVGAIAIEITFKFKKGTSKMNILMEGYLDRNFGDDMIIRIIAHQLNNYKFFIKENRKELLLAFINIDNIYDIEDYPNTKIDVIVRVTGSGFMITNKVGIYYAILRLIELLKLKNAKVSMAVLGCNVGPFINKFAKLISIIEMRQYNLITVRDKFSCDFTKKNIKKTTVYCYPDIVFSIPDEWIPPKTNEGCLGISAYRRGSKNNLQVYKKIAEIADSYIIENNKKVLIFAFDIENENDTVAAFTIKSLCRKKDMVEIILHNDNGDNIIKNMVRCKQVIAIRFHCTALALRIGIPFVPIIYSKKTAYVLNDLGYNGERFYIDDFKISDVMAFLKKEYLLSIDKNVIEAAKQH